MGLLKITFETLLRRPACCSADAMPAILNRKLSTSNKVGRYISAFSPPQINGPPDPKTVFQLNYCKFQSCLQLGAGTLAGETSKVGNQNEGNDDYSWTQYNFILSGPEDIEIDENFEYMCKQPYRYFWSFEVLLKFFRHYQTILSYHVWDKFEALELKFRTLDHEGSHLITDELYCDFCKRSCILLLEIEEPLTNIIEFEPRFVKPVNSSIKGENPDVKEWKKLGDEALELKKFEKAIKFYTNALITSGGLPNSCVFNDELVQLYTNRSVAYRELGDITSAEKNTACANYFSNLEFKVYANQKEVLYGIKEVLHHAEFDLDDYFTFDFFEKGIHSPRLHNAYE